MTARCTGCGEEWPRDPALEVECPDCKAGIGTPCRRPSGHAGGIHAARDHVAMETGFMVPCPAAGKQPPAEAQMETPTDPQLPLF